MKNKILLIITGAALWSVLFSAACKYFGVPGAWPWILMGASFIWLILFDLANS